MVFQPLDASVEIEEQPLTHFQRTGFTLVEWGGSIKKTYLKVKLEMN